MFKFTFLGNFLTVFKTELRREEAVFRFCNECKRHEGELYLGSKDKCKNCGFVVSLQGDFWHQHKWGPKADPAPMWRRWWPFNPQDELVQRTLKAIGYELYLEEGATMYFNYRWMNP